MYLSYKVPGFDGSESKDDDKNVTYTTQHSLDGVM